MTLTNSKYPHNTYNAAGIKLRKTAGSTATDYLGSFIYKDNELDYILTDYGKIDVKTYVNYGSGEFPEINVRREYTRQYNLTDHPSADGQAPGNVRVTFSESGEILQEDSYYPFGMTMNGLSYTSLNKSYEKNQYLYNGKELQEDFGLDWYDYGARFYDAQLGRFHTQDRFAEKYSFMSPYQYGADNPINFIDVNGDSLSIDKNTSLSFKIKTIFSLTVNYIFSPTARKYIKDAMSKDTPMNIITDAGNYHSYTEPMQIYEHDQNKPLIKEKFDTEKFERVMTKQSKIEYEKWKEEEKHLTKHKDGTGDGTMIYLSFSKKFRNDIKVFDKHRGYIHMVTAHELGHVYLNNHGINFYRGDKKHRNEILPLRIQNNAAKEFNRFRIRKFKTDVNTYK